jgi:hypothetical protein
MAKDCKFCEGCSEKYGTEACEDCGCYECDQNTEVK